MPFYSKVFDLFRGQSVYSDKEMKKLHEQKQAIKKEIVELQKKKEKIKAEQRKLLEHKAPQSNV